MLSAVLLKDQNHRSGEQLRSELYIDFRTLCVIMAQTRWPPPPVISVIPNFDKINSFLKPVLNIFILCNLIVGWGEGVIKEGASILYQIYRFRGA